MNTLINDERTGNLPLAFSQNFWTGKVTLVLDGVPLKKVARGRYVREEDGREFVLKGNQFTGFVLTSDLFPEPVQLTPKLKWYEIVMCVLPLIPALFFGAVGGAVGGVCMCVTLLILTGVRALWLKIVLTLEMTAVSGLGAFLLAYAVSLLLL